MRNFSFPLLCLILLSTNYSFSQCSGAQSFTLNPSPVNGNYEPGTVVTMCYTMNGWNGTGFGANWLEGFGLTLGPGWVSYVPIQEPINCSNDGDWLWLESATSASTGLSVGPGYFYEGPQGPVDGNSGNDWGDFGTTCQWTFCIQLQVTDECDPLSLLIEVTPYADGSMGSWTNESCFDPPFPIFNGAVSGGDVNTSPISIQMDTVCVGLSQNYSVINTPGSTYQWSISGGGTLTQNGSNFSSVAWGGVPGDYLISVQETTVDGCVGNPIDSQISVVDTLVTFGQSKTGICIGYATLLFATPSGGYWSGQNIEGSTFFGYYSGTYFPQYTVNIHGCTVTDSVEVFVREPFSAPIIETYLLDIDLCFNSNQQSYFTSDDPSIEYTWHVDGDLQDDTDYELNLFWPDTTMLHTIEVYGTDTIGCKSDLGYILIDIKACHRVYVPNSFTPNNDGFNDAFKITGLSIYEPRLKIYNRDGSVIYEIKSINDSWNGNDGNGYYCQSGVYNWTLTYKDDNGFGHVQKGHVVLIR
jgi:gliding motility-associated-like protein